MFEALREAWREKRMTADDLWRCAKICRVANVMRPYLEGQSDLRQREAVLSGR